MSRSSLTEEETRRRARSTVALRCQRSKGGPALRRGEPVTCGVPWPKGEVESSANLSLRDGQGRSIPLQARILDRWSDGSARWVLLDWLASTDGNGEYYVSASDGEAVEGNQKVLLERCDGGRGLVVHTGKGGAHFRLQVGSDLLAAVKDTEGRDCIDPARSGFRARDEVGRRFATIVDSLELVVDGPVRSAVRLRGELRRDSGPALARVTAILHFFAGSPTVRFELTVTNPRRAHHPRGCWSLGSGGSIYFRDLSLEMVLPSGSGRTEVTCSTESNAPLEKFQAPFEIYQDSSGGKNWASRNHVNRHGRVTPSFRGYRLYAGQRERRGRRATPIVICERESRWLGVTMQHFWQSFPKAIEVSSECLTLRHFPEQSTDLQEVQGGEQKTHVFHVAFDRDQVSEMPLAWCRAPLQAHADPEWYADSGAIPYLLPRANDSNIKYLSLVDAAIEGEDTFHSKRERIDEYGWRHFGDLYADHEAVRQRGSEPLISHYNNQYDAIFGFAVQYLRSGDPRWSWHMDELARHYIDIDIYHTDDDKSAYNQGHFWHTVHYTDAGTSTHRSFPPDPGTEGGGPCGGHLYATGLLHHYFLTGYMPSLETVITSGEYAIAADDGSKTILRFLDRGFTGVVSSSGQDTYHGPGRNPANSITALIDAHRAAGDDRFLAKCEQLIRRCIHPADDLEQRDLLDAENRWYYTMFLQSLGKYLDHKAELGELDLMYAHARAALLHYASWAVRHEYPYLENSEILEFPTETWAAQDMRKSEVFKIAALHSTGEDRQRFLERARFFFDSSVEQLSQAATRTLCRPVVLLLTLGYSQGFFDEHPGTAAPTFEEHHDFGEPEQFVPQKQRAKQKLVRFGLLIAVIVTVAAAMGFLFWIG